MRHRIRTCASITLHYVGDLGNVAGIATVNGMTLSSMVVSRDWQEVSLLECILGGLHMDVAVENEPQRALSRLAKSKIDALIVDCDLNGSYPLLHQLQSGGGPAQTVPLVIMGRPDYNHSLDQTGALFSFAKPISVEQAVRTLSAARNMILDGRLRYHRAGLEVPVSLNSRGRRLGDAYLVNLSQGGIRIHADIPVQPKKSLHVSFALPGTRVALKAKAEIRWKDERGDLGMRFVSVARAQQRTLELWLAREFLAN